jgi:small subunit ribosomal protein S1
MKQLQPDPWDGISDRYPAGTVLTGTVRNITNFGVFVEIEPGIDGLVHISDLSWTKKVRHPGDMINKGQDLDVVILNIDEERRRISLGHKQVKTNPWDQFADAYSEGNDTEAEVVRVEDKGLVVELPLDVEAFVPGSELKNGPRNFQSHYAKGDELELRVIRFDKSRKDIVLSETAKERQEAHQEREAERREERKKKQEERRSVQQYQDDSGDDSTSGPTTLGELSGLADLKAQMQEAERRGDVEQQAAEKAAAKKAAAEQAAVEEVSTEDDAEEAEASAEEDADATAEVDSADADSADADPAADTGDAQDFDESSGFPEGFPQTGRLESAGVMSVSDLREYADDFTEISGIGDAYAEEIEDALAAYDEKANA